jgi:release factor glutamine methyltransferase
MDSLFQTYIQRRLAGEPVSRIRGWREFWSLSFELSAATLDPRPDSEILVERAVAFGRDHPGVAGEENLRLLDMGTGSGCLLLACLSELTMATGVGIDINPDAIEMAAHNAGVLGLADRAVFSVADFTTSLKRLGCFDIILSNPPYIPSAQISTLSSEVALHDPLLALDGGQDGLDCWRVLMPEMAKLLSTQGRIFVEIGDGQEADVTALADAAGFSAAGVFADLSGTQRCLAFSRRS